MKDLTKDSVVKHVLTLSLPLGAGVLTQFAYHLVNLYFVAQIGVAATAGVNVAGNAALLVTALTQLLAVGTTALISHAAGRRDQEDANLIFNQSLILAVVCGVGLMALLYILIPPYLHLLVRDEATIDAGVNYIHWAMPGYAVMLPMTVLGSALRGVGVGLPIIAPYMLTVIANIVLAPILIAGWGAGRQWGVMGAGLATSLSVLMGAAVLGVYFLCFQGYLSVSLELMSPRCKQWWRILRIGLPAGGELMISFISAAVSYYTIRTFGPSAQAGYGIGCRVIQAVLLPGIAIALAAGPIAGQSFGAKDNERVREVFRKSVIMATIVTIATSILVRWHPTLFLRVLDVDTSTITVAAAFLELMSWTFVGTIVVAACSSMFQGLGNTVPLLATSGTNLLVFSVVATWVSTGQHFHIQQVWYVSMASVTLQALVSLLILRAEFKKRLIPMRVSAR